MKKILISSLLAASLATSINADFIGFEAGAAFWNASATGDVQYKSGTKFDLADNLGLDDNTGANFLWAVVEHPVPIIPNLKIEKSSFSVDSKTLSAGSFAGTSNVAVGQKSELILDQTDFKIYYELLDNWVNIDAGINIKVIDGSVTLGSTTEDISASIPMLYAKGKIQLPFSGFALEADVSTISFSGSSFTDAKAAILYETSYGLGATIGYKKESLNLDDISDYNAEISISGMYAGVFYHF